MKKNQKAAMTRKEALAVLHKLYDVVGWHLYGEDVGASITDEEKALREQVWDAFRILDRATHGEPLNYGFSSSLCEVCYLRYLHIGSNHLVYLKGHAICKRCCAQCLEHLKAEGKIERDLTEEEHQAATQQEREVTP
jgi:hypothetical protein